MRDERKNRRGRAGGVSLLTYPSTSIAVKMIRQASWIGPMTAFRLVRRLLLCSIVGVTVFGVAGWLLRPRANWELDCSQWNGRISLLNPDSDASVDEPIWVELAEPDTGVTKSVIAVDPQQGVVARQWDLTYPETRHPIFIADDGSLIATCGGRSSSTSFRLFDGRCGGEAIHRDLPGYWEPTGNSVWSFESPQGTLFALKTADLRSGAIETFEMTSPNEQWSRRPGARDLSPNCRRIVVQEPPTNDKVDSEAFQIWDVESKTMLLRTTLQLPKNAERGRIDRLRWIDAGRRIEVKATMWLKGNAAAQNLYLVFDPATRQFVEGDWRPTGIEESTGKAIEEPEDDGPLVVWTDRTKKDEPIFTVTQNRRTIVPWRRFPFAANLGLGWKLDWVESHPKILPTPESSALVFVSNEPTLWSLLPSGFQKSNPGGLGSADGEFEDRIRWHEWNRNEWRDVGFLGQVESIQVRPHAVITLTSVGQGNPTIQSWPLPPRDPKWLAAGMAALSFGGVWWLCARQAKRKLLAA